LKKTLEELANMVGGQLSGDGSTMVRGVAGIGSAEAGQITFLSNGKYRDKLHETDAAAVVIRSDEEMPSDLPSIQVDNPDLAFAKIADVFDEEDRGAESGIHDTSVVSEDAELGEDVSIQAHVTIEDGASIGDGTVIMSGSYIGKDVTLGANCEIFPNVNIMRETEMGDHVIVHASSVIGCDGFGYVKEGEERKKIPQLGRVVIEDHVEIGSCVTIDRARFDETRICEGAKIDNLVQIAHNVRIGKNAVIVSQSGVAGSSRIGDETMLGGQSGVAGHLEVGNGVRVAGRAGVTKDIDDGEVVSGFPAQPRSKFNRKQVLTRKLPALADDVSELKEKVERLSKALENNESESEDDSRDC
jgi:UDP-3-O-[3-hydroxymyristoyl] glucosamine N-acyltransferase